MASKKIIHISKDVKFIDSAIIQFENIVDYTSVFYVFVDDLNPEIKYVKQTGKVKIIKFKNIDSLLEECNQSFLVVFHSVIPAFYNLILSLNKKTKILWMFFGFEVYNDRYFFDDKKSYYDKTYSKYARFPISKREFFTDYIKDLLNVIFPNKVKISKYTIKKRVFRRINIIGAPFEEDYDTIKKLIGFKGDFFEFSYYPIELIVNNTEDDRIEDNKDLILVGNSGYYSSNHLDVLNFLKQSDLQNYSISIPLSYGKVEYIKQIICSGKEMFDESKINFLDQFMSIEEYNKILKNVKFAFLINRRQQAVGNTIALIYYGANVILSPDSSVYSFMKRIGVKVFSFNQISTLQNMSELSQTEILKNRSLITEYFSKENLNKKLIEQIKLIK